MSNVNRPGFTPMVPFMPADPRLAHAYVPYQLDITEYDIERALCLGTLYPAIYSPYDGRLDGEDRVC